MEEYNKGSISIGTNLLFKTKAFEISPSLSKFPWNNFTFIYVSAFINQVDIIGSRLYFSYKTYGFTC